MALRDAAARISAQVSKEGAILEHLGKAYLWTDQSISLEDFAVRYETFGDKIVASQMVSMQNDKLYGQWMALNIAYQGLEDLLPEIVTLVQFLACALRWAPELWRNEARVREYTWLSVHIMKPTSTPW